VHIPCTTRYDAVKTEMRRSGATTVKEEKQVPHRIRTGANGSRDDNLRRKAKARCRAEARRYEITKVSGGGTAGIGRLFVGRGQLERRPWLVRGRRRHIDFEKGRRVAGQSWDTPPEDAGLELAFVA